MDVYLSDLNIGDKGVVKLITATGEIRRRLLDMGLCKGAKFRILRIAPLGDPIVIKLKGFNLSLRMEEAGQITVQKIGFIGDGKPMGNRKWNPGRRSTGNRTASGYISPVSNSEGNRIRKSEKEINVALLGNPNSGKTSLFNSLAGAHQKVGNFSGVTVEKFEGKIKYGGYLINLIDLPGTYSLTAYSPEEIVARNYIINEKPDIVIDVVDGSSLERNLYLTTQVMELEVNMLVALNMYDEVKKAGIKIDIDQLEVLLGSHVIPTSAIRNEGVNSLLDHVIKVHQGNITIAKNKLVYSQVMEEKIGIISEILRQDEVLVREYNLNWLAVKLLENDQLVYEIVKGRSIWVKVETELRIAIGEYKKHFKSDPEVVITEDRHAFIRGAMRETVDIPEIKKRSTTDLIDNIFLNRILGLPIFFGIMWLVFQLTFKLGEIPMNWIELLFGTIGNWVSSILPDGYIKSVLVDGIISGVGGVLVFIPNILLLFLAIAFLEGTGYMARAAFVIDKVMHKIGLHGKSFIPMMTGFGCSVPALMACRTLKSSSDRITTMMIIPFMSCGAKLPVYILLISAFFSAGIAGNILFGIYMFGVLIAFISAFILKKALFKGKSEPFVMELPPYRMPSLKSLLFQISYKTKMYLKKAGTIILAASVLIWIMSNFPIDKSVESELENSISIISQDSSLTFSEKESRIKKLQNSSHAEMLEYSFAGRFGKFIEPVIKPLGFDWKVGISLTAGLAAKEIVVSSLSTIYALGADEEDEQKIAELIRDESGFNKATALSLMVFVLLYVPCLAASAIFHKEAGKWKWTAIYVGYSMTAAWILSFITYRIGLLVF